MASLSKPTGDLQGQKAELLGIEQDTGTDFNRTQSDPRIQVRTGLASPHSASFPPNVQYEQQDYAGQCSPYAQPPVVIQQAYGYGSPTQPQFQYSQAQLCPPYTYYPSPIFTGQGYQPYIQQQQYPEGAPFTPTYSPAPGSAFPGSPLPLRTSTTPTSSSPASTASRRRLDHPDPPADRSEWVMWVGNVPNDATPQELQRFFTNSAGAGATNTSWEQDGSGVLSVFPITRSNCAFVNYMTEAHLHAAVARFNGVPLRAGGHYAPLVCRLRARDDDLRAGVGAQRGFGMHRRWVKAQQKQGKGKGKAAATVSPPPLVPLPHSASPANSSSSDSASASTSSSLLERYFPDRYFILKSLTQEDLDLSFQRGVWATQRHNERVFDRAFRTSKNVYFIFSVNKSGEFYGYARMSGPLNADPDARVQWARRESSGSGSHAKSAQVERPQVLSSEHLVQKSPSPLGSARDTRPDSESEPFTQSAPPAMDYGIHEDPFENIAPALKLSLDAYPAGAGADRSRRDMRPLSRGSIDKHKGKDKDKDMGRGTEKSASLPVGEGKAKATGKEQENAERDRAEWGEEFPLQWLCTVRLPFERTRHIRNPWNHGREVKISRDGTELEPSVGRALLAAWGNIGLG